jgi:hypothetical protein
VSATQALQKLRTAPSKNVSTGLPRLDELLTKARPMPPSGSKVDNAKGLCCGHIADVYGPPGSGKTALWYNIYLLVSIIKEALMMQQAFKQLFQRWPKATVWYGSVSEGEFYVYIDANVHSNQTVGPRYPLTG